VNARGFTGVAVPAAGGKINLLEARKHPSVAKRMFGKPIYRPVWLPVAITAAMLMIALYMLLGTASRSLDRLRPLHTHLDRLMQAQQVSLDIQQLFIRHLGNESEINAADLARARASIEQLLTQYPDADSGIGMALHRALDAVTTAGDSPRRALANTLVQLDRVVDAETRAQDKEVTEVKQGAKLELDIASGVLLLLPAVGLLLMFLVRHRILLPLSNLGWLMTQLERQDYTTAASSEVDPMLRPLMENYNSMVNRLAELEREHRARQDSLQSQVDSAARTLLDQQRTLANAERLAAVGEVAARLAHELRNPLAGMQMALSNLQRETADPEHAERLGLVANELMRVTGLLNSLLDRSRHQPEASRQVCLAEVIGELFTLARYQLPDHIRLENQVPANLHWQLPENALRRTILNLVLNARQAMGETHGVISVSARAEAQQLRIEVCDDGPGFPAELLATGIQPFSSTRPDGTGLGLASVQRFAQSLHGSIQLHNRAPHGACVTLLLPTGEGHGQYLADH
jgi:two-component system NtrC family sensor kinase